MRATLHRAAPGRGPHGVYRALSGQRAEQCVNAVSRLRMLYEAPTALRAVALVATWAVDMGVPGDCSHA